MRQAARVVGLELLGVFDLASTGARLAGEDLSRLVGDPRTAMRPRPRTSDTPPADLIREIGRLRDEGLITEEEFQAKKADLLSRV
jgi:hypothetical protein